MPARPFEAITNCPIFFGSGVGTPQEYAEGLCLEPDDQVKADNELRRFLACVGDIASLRKSNLRWASRFILHELSVVTHFHGAG
jgi:hypothetical protein